MASPSPAPTKANHSEPPAPSRAPSRASANTKAFWALMEQWGVSDATALELIGFSGKSGKRPRFRLNTHQVQLLECLQELRRAAETAHGSPSAWLNHRQRAAPMNGRTQYKPSRKTGRPRSPHCFTTSTGLRCGEH